MKQEVLPQSFPGVSHLYSWLPLKWLGGSMVTCLISSALANGSPATPLAFSLQSAFWTVTLLISIFCNLDGSRVSQIINSWCLAVLPSIYLLPLKFYYKQQEETRLHPLHFAWKSPQLHIQVPCSQVLLSSQQEDIIQLSFLPWYNKDPPPFWSHVPHFLWTFTSSTFNIHIFCQQSVYDNLGIL